MDEVVAIADRLYAGPTADFTAARDCADQAVAARVKRLRKPSVAAWAVNVLVRREASSSTRSSPWRARCAPPPSPSTAPSCAH